MELKDRIRQLREESGLTLIQFAALADVDKATMSRLENGLTRKPSYVTLARIAWVLHISVDDLMRGVDYEEELS